MFSQITIAKFRENLSRRIIIPNIRYRCTQRCWEVSVIARHNNILIRMWHIVSRGVANVQTRWFHTPINTCEKFKTSDTFDPLFTAIIMYNEGQIRTRDNGTFTMNTANLKRKNVKKTKKS